MNISCKFFPLSVLAAATLQVCSGDTQAAIINLGSTCSLRDAIVAANTDAMVSDCLAGNGDDTIVMQANSTVNLMAIDAAGGGEAGLPTITSNVSIQGNNSIITRDNAAPDFRLFSVAAGAQLEIDSLSLTNGRLNGSAIKADNATSLVITNSTITGHSSNNEAGVSVDNTNVSISNSTISDNSGANHPGLFIENGDLVLHETTISGNSASNSGAGIYVGYGNNVEIIDSTITNNQARLRGGAYLLGNPSVVVIDSEFNNNTGNMSGLAIAEFEKVANFQISNVQASGNQGSGAGMYLYASNNLGQSSIATISNVSASSNISAGEAGMQLEGPQLVATVTGATVSQNQGGTRNSGISITSSAQVQLTDITLDNNSGSRPFGRSGLSANRNSQVTVNNATITNNLGYSTSAGINVSGEASMSIQNSRIADNSLLDGTSSAVHSPIFVSGGSLELVDTTVIDNTSSRNGGAIKVLNSSSNLTILNSTIANNSVAAGYSGGGIFIEEGDNLVITNSTLSGNAADSGAALYLGNLSSVEINNVTITQNEATNGSGALYFSSFPASLSVNNALFSGNQNDDCNTALPISFGGGNWFEDSSCNGIAQGPINIGVLQDNDGPTFTHALNQGSPAIDAGINAICSSAAVAGLDQRGERRDSACDIGAYEFIAPDSFYVIPIKGGRTVVVPL